MFFATFSAIFSVVFSPALAAAEVSYTRDIKPLLSESCYTCHGPDAETREADLRLDVDDESARRVLAWDDSTTSELLRRITSTDPDLQMPPPDSGRSQLNEQQVARIREWVEQGGDFQQHWAWTPVERPELPPEYGQQFANPIDGFIAARLDEQQLRFSPRADARTLLRRLYFDLTGLPPQFARLDDELTELDTEAGYVALVDRLLASPAFGERMASYWLDTVRYADSVGIHGDQEVSMSPYRDYVIDAFNSNKPYDEFLTEQLAGDLLPDATVQQRVASAFNRLHMVTSEGGAQPKEYLAIYSADRVRNTAAALMGVTLGCAQCHDHKFDPFSTREFYEFAAFFADLKEAGVYGGNNWFPKLEVPSTSQAERLSEFERQIRDLEQQLAAASESDQAAQQSSLEDLKKQLDAFRKQIPTVLVSQSVEPRTLRVLPRGNWLDDTGPVVEPAFPVSLTPNSLTSISTEAKSDGPSPSKTRLGRLELARWMTDPANPLVARVFVNRLWKLMLGEGIVRTPDDFGSQGRLPTHPQLLDWLAAEFVESGWNVKHLIRLIATSQTYQQQSLVSETHRSRDPTNQWLARQNRFRLDAEMVRDQALSAGGLLIEKIGGPSVRPYQPAGYYSHLNFPRREYQASDGSGLYRRTVYTHWQRTFLHPSLMAFDAPSREECTVQRSRSNTPLQSLVLLNDPIYVEAARMLAQRVLTQDASAEDANSNVAERLHFAFQAVLQRVPSDSETAAMTQLLHQHRQHFSQHPDEAAALRNNGRAPVDEQIDESELAAWTSVCRVLLSLHETITRS